MPILRRPVVKPRRWICPQVFPAEKDRSNAAAGITPKPLQCSFFGLALPGQHSSLIFANVSKKVCEGPYRISYCHLASNLGSPLTRSSSSNACCASMMRRAVAIRSASTASLGFFLGIGSRNQGRHYRPMRHSTRSSENTGRSATDTPAGSAPAFEQCSNGGWR